MLELEDENTSPTLIKVFGVGGGGMNAVNRMIDASLRGVEFFVVNTDEQVLKKSTAENRIQIGQRATMGMGAGGDPEIGMRAAMEDKDSLTRAMQGADMIFVTAGMGGGTGTGAAPVVAEAAREHGALTVGVVTIPFEFEGRKRMELARRGIEELRQKVDTLITIKNESLFKVIDRSTSVRLAFRMVDDILLNAVKGLSDLINTAGIVNVDFADVRAIMDGTGDAIMGAGEGVGENRVVEAVNQAINNVLLEETGIEGATALLINVCGGEDMSMAEWKEVSEIITERADPGANIIIGLTVDENLSSRIRVTVIATGFRKRVDTGLRPQAAEENGVWHDYPLKRAVGEETPLPGRNPVISLRRRDREDTVRMEDPAAIPARDPRSGTSVRGERMSEGHFADGYSRSGEVNPQATDRENAPRPRRDYSDRLDLEDLEVPAYLRRRNRN